MSGGSCMRRGTFRRGCRRRSRTDHRRRVRRASERERQIQPGAPPFSHHHSFIPAIVWFETGRPARSRTSTGRCASTPSIRRRSPPGALPMTASVRTTGPSRTIARSSRSPRRRQGPLRQGSHPPACGRERGSDRGLQRHPGDRPRRPLREGGGPAVAGEGRRTISSRWPDSVAQRGIVYEPERVGPGNYVRRGREQLGHGARSDRGYRSAPSVRWPRSRFSGGSERGLVRFRPSPSVIEPVGQGRAGAGERCAAALRRPPPGPERRKPRTQRWPPPPAAVCAVASPCVDRANAPRRPVPPRAPGRAPTRRARASALRPDGGALARPVHWP